MVLKSSRRLTYFVLALLIVAITRLLLPSVFSNSTPTFTNRVTTTANVNSAFDDFDHWAAAFLMSPDPNSPAAIEGMELAKVRRRALAKMIEADPQAALERSVPFAVRAKLPDIVVSHLEERVEGHGKLLVVANCQCRSANCSGSGNVSRTAVVNNKEYSAFTYGRRIAQTSKYDIPVYGIAIDGKLALSENPARLLERGEEPNPGKVADTLGGRFPAAGTTLAAAGNSLYRLAAPHQLSELSSALADQEVGLSPFAGSAASRMNRFEVPNGPWTKGTKKVLIMVVDYPDAPGAPLNAGTNQPLTKSDIDALMTVTKSFYEEASYGQTSLQWTIVTQAANPNALQLLTMSKNHIVSGVYSYPPYSIPLESEAQAAAKAYGLAHNLNYDTANYDLEIVFSISNESTGFKGGQAPVGAKGCQIFKFDSPFYEMHELGHCFGLFHCDSRPAGPFITEGGATTPIVNYGNEWDVMGYGHGTQCHFNSSAKNLLGWLPDSKVQTVTSSGTYKIYTFDQPDITLPNEHYALKMTRFPCQTLWFEFRQKVLNNPWQANGVDMIIGPVQFSQGLITQGHTFILDMMPFTNQQDPPIPDVTVANPIPDTKGSLDAALVIGRTFSDLVKDVHVTPIGKNGTAPESINIVVNYGPFPNNNAPVISSFTSSAANVATNTPVTFTVTASDPDGDTLAYYMEFDDSDSTGINPAIVGGKTILPNNQPVVVKSWSTPGIYNVLCEVSDMKGGKATSITTVTVGAPGQYKISGTIRNASNGNAPMANVLITNGKPGYDPLFRSAYTDAAGQYSLFVPGGGITYTVKPFFNGFSFSPTSSSVTVANADKPGVDFTHTDANYIVGGRVFLDGNLADGETVHFASVFHGVSSNNDIVTANGGKYQLAFPEGTAVSVSVTKAGYQFNTLIPNSLIVGSGDYSSLFFLGVSANIPVIGFSAPGSSGETSVANPSIQVSLNKPANGNVNIYWSVVESGTTAVPFVDYPPVNNATSGQNNISLSPGQLSTFIPLTILNNPAISMPRTIVLKLSIDATISAALGNDTYIYTITNNKAPTDIALSSSSIFENQPIGSTVGLFSSADPNSGDTFTYTLLPGGADNALFSISGSSLRTAAIFNYETKSSYSILVRSTDQSGLFFDKPFNITITDVNESPLDITLSSTSMPENQPAGTTVGMLSTVDPDAGNTFSYVLQAGGIDNAAFNLVGNTLKTAAVFNYQAQSSYSILIRSTDQGGLYCDKTIVITVTPDNPQILPPTISSVTITPNPVTGTTALVNATATDPNNPPQLLTYTWSATGPANVSFSPNNSTNAANSTATFSAAGSYTISVQVSNTSTNSSASAPAIVTQTLTTITVVPSSLQMLTNGTQQFSASGIDQFGAPMTPQPSFTWSVSQGTGSVDSSGLFTASATAGAATLTATSGTVNGSASITVVKPIVDTTAPVLSVPSELNVPATSEAGAIVSFVVSATDNVDQILVATAAPSSGSLFPIGTTTVTCQAADAAGNIATGTFKITVLLSFASPAVATPAEGNVGDVMNFSASPIHPGAILSWDFGDGSSGTGISVSHVYTTPGTFAVTATATLGNMTVQSLVSMPISPIGNGQIAGAMKLTKLGIVLKFADPQSAQDTMFIQGTLAINQGFDPNGKRLDLRVGGILREFDLNSLGKGISGADTFKINLKRKKGVVTKQASKFTALLTGNFKATLGQIGFKDENNKKSISVPIETDINLDGTFYKVIRNEKFNSVSNVSGTAK